MELDLNDLDPTNTEFNSLVRPEERQPLTFGQSSYTHTQEVVTLSSMVSSPSSSFGSGSSSTCGPRFRFPGNPSPVRFLNNSRYQSPAMTPSSVYRGPGPSQSNPQPSPTSSQADAQSLTGITPLSTASGSEILPDQQVEFVRQDASVEFVEVVGETPKSGSKRTRKATVKGSDMNVAASNYYVKMLEIQKRLAEKQFEVLEKKVSLLRRREKNEKLKSKLLKKQLGEAVNSDSSDDSDKESEEDMETLDQVEFFV